MRITVTFTETGEAGPPEGYAIVFDADECQISEGCRAEEASCASAGCPGCDDSHSRLADMAFLKVNASGKRHALRNFPKAGC